ncbi:hypothetical protein DBV15_12937, partial [Temnothorax longispinosus]
NGTLRNFVRHRRRNFRSLLFFHVDFRLLEITRRSWSTTDTRIRHFQKRCTWKDILQRLFEKTVQRLQR